MKFTPQDILTVLKMVDAGYLKLKYVGVQDNEDGGYDCNPRFKVEGLPLEFVVFNDCGEWDYLDSVYEDGQLVADYEKINRSWDDTAVGDEEYDWAALGNYVPNLSAWRNVGYDWC